jgi:hypothetical protein
MAPYIKKYVFRTFEMFQLTLPMGLEELVALKAGSLQFDQSSKLLAQFQVVDQVISTKDNQTKLQVK